MADAPRRITRITNKNVADDKFIATIRAKISNNKEFLEYVILYKSLSRDDSSEKIKEYLETTTLDLNRHWSSNIATPLIYVILKKRLDLVQLFHEKGTPLDKEIDGWFPIHYAAHDSTIEIIRYLLNNGAEINTRISDTGETSLFIAIEAGNIQIAFDLLDLGADIHSKTSTGVTPLFYAIKHENIPLIHKLIDMGSTINVVANIYGGLTPLFTILLQTTATPAIKHTIVSTLVSEGADVAYRNTKMLNPLYLACDTNDTALVGYILLELESAEEERRDPFLINTLLETDVLPHEKAPLFLACEKNNIEMVRLLLRYRPVANHGNPKMNPIHVATSKKNAEIVHLLVLAGADINAQMTHLSVFPGYTPLFLASRTKATQLVQYFLEKGADVTIHPPDEDSLVKLAQGNELIPEIRSLILAHTQKQIAWTGISRSDVEKFDTIFATEGGRSSEAVNFSNCPICLTYIERREACMYMNHNCAKENVIYSVPLYKKYKTEEGRIYWCTVCGRICVGHRHYSLGLASGALPALTPIVADADLFAEDCVPQGGGGLLEKLARFRRGREYMLELQEEVGKISALEAKEQLIEEMWNAPFYRTRKVAKIARNKAWNIPSSAFPANTVPQDTTETTAPTIPWPNQENIQLHPILHDTGYDITMMEDVQDAIQFRHIQENRSVNNHEDTWIGLQHFFSWLQTQNTQFGLESFGYCWNYTSCTAFLYPQEIQKVLDMAERTGEDKAHYESILQKYSELFNRKFAGRSMYGGRNEQRRKTRKKQKRRTMVGGDGSLPFFVPMTTGQCVLKQKGGTRKRGVVQKKYTKKANKQRRKN